MYLCYRVYKWTCNIPSFHTCTYRLYIHGLTYTHKHTKYLSYYYFIPYYPNTNTILILYLYYIYTFILQNDTRLTKKRDAKDLIKLKTPSQPSDKGPNASNNSFFFTQYVMKNRIIDQTRTEVSMKYYNMFIYCV